MNCLRKRAAVVWCALVESPEQVVQGTLCRARLSKTSLAQGRFVPFGRTRSASPATRYSSDSTENLIGTLVAPADRHPPQSRMTWSLSTLSIQWGLSTTCACPRISANRASCRPCFAQVDTAPERLRRRVKTGRGRGDTQSRIAPSLGRAPPVRLRCPMSDWRWHSRPRVWVSAHLLFRRTDSRAAAAQTFEF